MALLEAGSGICILLCGCASWYEHVVCVQEMYREMLLPDGKLRKRFLQLAEEKGLDKDKVIKKLEQGKAHGARVQLEVWQAPVDFTFVDVNPVGKLKANIVRTLALRSWLLLVTCCCFELCKFGH